MKEIKDLIANDDLENSFSNIKSMVSEHLDLYNEICSIENQYYRIKKDNRKGLISYQEYSLGYSNIVNNVLTFTDSIPENKLKIDLKDEKTEIVKKEGGNIKRISRDKIQFGLKRIGQQRQRKGIVELEAFYEDEHFDLDVASLKVGCNLRLSISDDNGSRVGALILEDFEGHKIGVVKNEFSKDIDYHEFVYAVVEEKKSSTFEVTIIEIDSEMLEKRRYFKIKY
jgi:hypothetical protein